MRPRFRIGDYVEVKAIVRTARTCGPRDDPAEPWQQRACYKKLARGELPAVLRGWIVGAARRFEGRIDGQRTEDGDQPYLVATGSKLVWLVAQSMMNRPVEALDEDVTLVSPYAHAMPPYPPLRLGFSWEEAHGAASAQRARDEQREIMRTAKRDANGRWLPVFRDYRDSSGRSRR